jgi:hypothetical protein
MLTITTAIGGDVAGNAQSSSTPQAREHKLKEMNCNIFHLNGRDEVQLFTRKKRSISSSSQGCI